MFRSTSRQGQHDDEGQKGWLRRCWWVFPAVPVVLIVGVAVALYVSYQRIELPKTPPPMHSTFMYDRDGKVIASLHGSVDRTIIGLGQMSPKLQHAVIAVEDNGFYDHPGIDVTGRLPGGVDRHRQAGDRAWAARRSPSSS